MEDTTTTATISTKSTSSSPSTNQEEETNSSVEGENKVIDNEEEEEEEVTIDWDELTSNDSDLDKEKYEEGTLVLVKTKQENRIQIGKITTNNPYAKDKYFRIKLYESNVFSERAMLGDNEGDQYEIKEKVNWKESLPTCKISYNGIKQIKKVSGRKRPSVLVCDFYVENPVKKKNFMTKLEELKKENKKEKQVVVVDL